VCQRITERFNFTRIQKRVANAAISVAAGYFRHPALRCSGSAHRPVQIRGGLAGKDAGGKRKQR